MRCRVGRAVQCGQPAVDLCRHGGHFVAQSQVNCEGGPQVYVILNVTTEDARSKISRNYWYCWNGGRKRTRVVCQETIAVRIDKRAKREVAGGSVVELSQLNSFHSKAQFQTVNPFREKDI